MEIAKTISSPSQIPQSLAEITPAEELGGIQGKSAQSPSFGLLFDQCAGMTQGERLQNEAGSNNLSQAQLKGESPAEPKTGEANLDGPFRGPLLRETSSYSADLFKMAKAAPDRNSLQLPEQTTADSGASSPGKGVNSSAGPTKGDNSVAETSTPKVLPGFQQKIGKGGITGVITTKTCVGLRTDGASKEQTPRENLTALGTTREFSNLAAEGGQSVDPPLAERPREASAEGGKTDAVWTPLIVVGNHLSEGNFATSLPGSFGEVQQQGDAQPENNAGQAAMQPGDFLQTEVGASTGYGFKETVKVSDTLLASGTLSQLSISKGAELSHESLPGIDALPGKFGGDTESTTKTGGGAVNPEARGDIQASQDNLSSWIKGKYSEAVDIFRPEAAPASQMQSRASSDSAANAYQASKAVAEQLGKSDVSSMPVNVAQGKPAATPDSTTAYTGMSPDQVKIIFAEEPGANRKDQGKALSLESGDSKTADNASTPAFATNPAELRTSGESSVATPSPGAENPLGDHIANQIREKLDAGGLGSDNGQITLKLHPEELGELKINMRMENQHLKVEITAQNPSVKDALMQNLDTLKETLSRQNIAMDRFDVSAGIQQGLHQGGRDGKQMTQDNRVNNSGIQHAEAKEEDVAPKLQYRWESADSLVNLVL